MKRFFLIFICVLIICTAGIAEIEPKEIVGDDLPPITQPISDDTSTS